MLLAISILGNAIQKVKLSFEHRDQYETNVYKSDISSHEF